MTSADGLPGLARLLAARPPSCGPVRLVGVDGHAGSGKSTLAGRLSGLLGGAPVLHLDDLASHDAFFGWTERFAAQVAGPLARGARAHFEAYDWHRRAFTREGEIAPRPVVLAEGVGAGRRELRPLLCCLLWMDLPREAAWARGRRRDGPELAEFWGAWTRAEEAHFAADPTRPRADLLVRERGAGYEVRRGPGGQARHPGSITLGDMSTVVPGNRQAGETGRA
ncbi:uridine kinase [Streptomyces sp. JJ36]|uniref:uridine kinase family protein n=1 Tax=Streptomyces sp. JJ36 TaxID=2736645 RepID=UPI001F3340FE|nr:hypothetical protein [Streptomyces sp. JJ36]